MDSTLESPGASPRTVGGWITVVQIGLLLVVLALSGYVASQVFRPKPVAAPSIGRASIVA